MAKYPNDPGPDCHTNHGHHRPHEEMTLITTEVFLDGISLQTKYAYKCSHDFYHQSLKHADGIGAALMTRLSEAELGFTSALNDHVEALSILRGCVNQNAAAIRGVSDTAVKLGDALNDRMTDRDHCCLLEQVYSMC